MRKQGHVFQLYVPLRMLCQEQIAVLGGLPAGVQDLDDPADGHPRTEQVCHGADEDGLALGLMGRLIEAVSVEGWVEAIRVRGADGRGLEDMMVSRGPLRLSEPAGHPPGVAVRAAVLAAGNRVPGAVAPFDAGLVHLPLTPSRSRQLFTQDGMG